MTKPIFALLPVLAAALSLGVRPANGAIVNGSFETSTFSGWSTIGDTSIVTSSFGSGPTSGVNQALIEGGTAGATVPNLEVFLGVAGGSLDALGNGVSHGGSAIKQTFTAVAGQTLTFDWNFITDEAPPSIFNDFAFFSVSSLSTMASANGAALIPFGSLLQTGFQQTSFTLSSTGTYTLTLGVANVSDIGGLPQLLVDNVTLTSAVPEPAYSPAVILILTLVQAASHLVNSRRRPMR